MNPSQDTKDIWRKAVDEALITNYLGTTDGCETVEEAMDKLEELIRWEIKVATDPAVNGGYKLSKADKPDAQTGEIV